MIKDTPELSLLEALSLALPAVAMHTPDGAKSWPADTPRTETGEPDLVAIAARIRAAINTTRGSFNTHDAPKPKTIHKGIRALGVFVGTYCRRSITNRIQVAGLNTPERMKATCPRCLAALRKETGFRPR